MEMINKRVKAISCKTDIISIMHECVLGLHAERNCAIYKRKVFDGCTFEKVAEEFDLTDRQVKNIVYKIATIVYSHLNKE